ncbi:MAG: hypothetical protein HY698_05180 [Deltaproteobacteria bacterium]|nr:hypothetical protein [Deltaproteobacteria bacterium]
MPLGRPSAKKRQRELDLQEHRREKEARRSQRKAERARPRVAEGEDPDLVGIRPGPQPDLVHEDGKRR